MIKTANQAIKTTQQIVQLFDQDRQKIETLGRSAASVLIVHHYLKKHAITTITKAAQQCSITIPTVIKSMTHLEQLGIVQEITGKARHRIYAYQKYLSLLEEIEDF